MKLTLYSNTDTFSIVIPITKFQFALFPIFETKVNKSLLEELERQNLIQINNTCCIIRKDIQFEINQ